MKAIRFLGDSLKALQEFPEDARRDAGRQLARVQKGKPADDFKPMPSIGKGVEEIRVWEASGTYRVVYTARLAETVVVLHAFQKKVQLGQTIGPNVIVKEGIDDGDQIVVDGVQLLHDGSKITTGTGVKKPSKEAEKGGKAEDKKKD